MEKNKTVSIAISNWKGGAGKTTNTVLIAALINYHTDKKVAVIDVDPQHSSMGLRERELKLLKNASENGTVDPVGTALGELREKGKIPCRIIPIHFSKVKESVEETVRTYYKSQNFDLPADKLELLINADINKHADDLIVAKIKNIIETGGYDYIFYDFPGYKSDQVDLKDDSIFSKIRGLMNYVLVPLNIDPNTVSSTMAYLKMLKQIKVTGSPDNELIDFAAFQWKFSKAKNTEVFENFTESVRKAGINVFESKIYDSNDFMMTFSTIKPVDLPKEKSLMFFMNELIKFCSPKNIVTV